jgi:uncharacterized membrane protein YqgA involved in biofilm formation
MLMGIGLGLLSIKTIQVENFLPALVFAPLCVLGWRKLRKSGVPVA